MSYCKRGGWSPLACIFIVAGVLLIIFVMPAWCWFLFLGCVLVCVGLWLYKVRR